VAAQWIRRKLQKKDVTDFIIIQGTGGIGKSTLMKHLFINELEQKSLIPVFLELKDINDFEKNYEINDIGIF
jgi:predicted AAA+ superfamily ATPase